ncbi:DUF2125 domain-containing protein [Chelatococcus sp. SYSU_G07232]|uniref:DUF2125 domain-containing protein n=1 Tax=Chelatococcus albus TaxID=3047466 RepID=A0ABT7ADI4_9HYPH|nr:DUF2125 domain-containing protein [Chelatococcus sp. SYSU_G07232]MDJ1157441.1 DUF2125 domain-containing protein [Chelatococcus sp. SYSU_G07232]
MADIETTARTRRHSRWGLFLPFILLVLIAAGWSAFWFVARERTTAALDQWVAREAEHGRRWTCPARTVGGFPFRFELTCDNPSFSGTTAQGPVEGSLKRFLAVAQVYRPNHVIAEAEGPLVVRAVGDGRSLELNWRSLDASIILPGGRLERASLVIEAPALRATLAADNDALVSFASRLEAHLRRDPARPEGDKAYDVAVSLNQAVVPPLDDFLGSSEAADLDARAVVTQAEAFGVRPRAEELEAWRLAGGRLELSSVTLVKGATRIEARGTLGLDEQHRPSGQVDAAVAGLDGLLARFGIKVRGDLSGLITGGLERLAGRQPAPLAGDGAVKAGPKLTSLPPVRIDNGRITVGPFPVGRVGPLY